MKKVLPALLLIAAAYFLMEYRNPTPTVPVGVAPQTEQTAPSSTDAIARAFTKRDQARQVHGNGTVERILADDTDGSRHQRFILRLGSGQTVLIAHNIDVAPRIGSLQPGDLVSFSGEYAWNERGGVIHWTHHDPQGRHPDGWLEHEGRRYD